RRSIIAEPRPWHEATLRALNHLARQLVFPRRELTYDALAVHELGNIAASERPQRPNERGGILTEMRLRIRDLLAQQCARTRELAYVDVPLRQLAVGRDGARVVPS